MTSNEERREVAARLRKSILTEGAADIEERMGLKPLIAARFVAVSNLIAALSFDKGIVSMCELANRLADLIEPEPERTCIMRFYLASNLWRCSECDGKTYAERTNDEKPDFCQWCGAKVVN